jgi:antitoxin HicB
MSDDIEKGHLGQSFSDFLKEQGTYEETVATSIKRVVAWQLQQVMAEQKITKVEMAKRLDTSRSQLDRLLDPENDKISLSMLSRAASAVGRKLTLELR